MESQDRGKNEGKTIKKRERGKKIKKEEGKHRRKEGREGRRRGGLEPEFKLRLFLQISAIRKLGQILNKEQLVVLIKHGKFNTSISLTTSKILLK